MKAWWTAAELAGLPGMPKHERSVNRLGDKGELERRPRERGKGWEYSFGGLPQATRDELIKRALVDGSEPAPAALPQPKPAPQLPAKASELRGWQREVMEARLALLREIERLVRLGATKETSINKVCDLAQAGELPERLQEAVALANFKSGKRTTARGRKTKRALDVKGTQVLSARTVKRWFSKLRDYGEIGLAPPAPAPEPIPAWARPLLRLYGQPQKPSLYSIVSEKLPPLLPDGVTPPSYDQAKRFLAKLDPLSRNKGRMGQREMKALRPYVSRDTSEFLCADIYQADGHTFDAEVAHPDHGRPFRPEVTGVIDMVTRLCVGWSVALAESTWAVADALRSACERWAVPAIWYTDRGKGQKNAALEALLDRVGSSHELSIAYNSQARGISERSHQSIWVRLAKELPTYIGADMDREAKQKVHKITRADIKASGYSPLLLPWREFVAALERAVEAYNNRPHSGLPKTRDPETGRVRHMTPMEAWAESLEKAKQEGLAEAIAPVPPEVADDLFRPYKSGVKVDRGQVSLFGNTYFSKDLTHYHGERVSVGYDIHDAERVWVRDSEERLIAIATFDGNKRKAFPEPVVEQGREARAKRRAAALQRKLDEVELERRGGALEAPAAEMSAEDQALADQMFAQLAHQQREREAVTVDVEPENEADSNVTPMRRARPMFGADSDKWEWLQAHPGAWTDDDRRWLDWYESTSEYQLMYG